MPTAAFYTLGCKVNQYETERIRAELESYGFVTVPFSQSADVYLINSCTVTGTADSKSRSAVRQAVRRNPHAVVVATGCYTELDPAAITAIEGVDLIVPNAEKDEIAERISARFPGLEKSSTLKVAPRTRTRAVVKVQDGCSQYCAYCAIPYARSKKTCRPFEEVLDEIRQLADYGYKEVVLAGIRLGSYASDDKDIAALAQAVAGVDGIERVRLSSIEAWEITGRLLDVMADSPILCRHLHIPLQSGDDGVLKGMRRPYDASRYLEIVHKARTKIPGLAVTTDVMVGFPGETDEAFENTLSVVGDAEFSRLHVFRYSKRPKTLAAKMPDQVDERVKEERSSRLIAVGEGLMRSFAGRIVGQTFPILVESRRPAPALLAGLTDNYVEVTFRGNDSLKGQVVRVEIERTEGQGAFGRVISNQK